MPGPYAAIEDVRAANLAAGEARFEPSGDSYLVLTPCAPVYDRRYVIAQEAGRFVQSLAALGLSRGYRILAVLDSGKTLTLLPRGSGPGGFPSYEDAEDALIDALGRGTVEVRRANDPASIRQWGTWIGDLAVGPPTRQAAARQLCAELAPSPGGHANQH